MGKTKTDMARVHLQDQILARFGPEKLEEARARLCVNCCFHLMHGRPCHLLPLTLEGADCSHFGPDALTGPGGNHNG
jgi:hypothetical protein